MNTKEMDESLIAVCGVNCGICRLHLQTRRQCDGCRGKDTYKPASCIRCVIKECKLRTAGVDFCFKCEHYPCVALIKEDKRCRSKFGVGPIEHLEYIRQHGMQSFLENQKERWTCKTCGSIISIQNGYCDQCAEKEV